MSINLKYPDLTLEWKEMYQGYKAEVGERHTPDWRCIIIQESDEDPDKYVLTTTVSAGDGTALVDQLDGLYDEHSALFYSEQWLNQTASKIYIPGQD